MPTLALACPVPQGVKLRAQSLTNWGRDGDKFLRERVERMAQAVPEPCIREERQAGAQRRAAGRVWGRASVDIASSGLGTWGQSRGDQSRGSFTLNRGMVCLP
jgi:hypothetical protein